jgi:hypothetical protein
MATRSRWTRRPAPHDDARRTVELVEAEVLAPVGGETMPG